MGRRLDTERSHNYFDEEAQAKRELGASFENPSDDFEARLALMGKLTKDQVRRNSELFTSFRKYLQVVHKIILPMNSECLVEAAEIMCREKVIAVGRIDVGKGKKVPSEFYVLRVDFETQV